MKKFTLFLLLGMFVFATSCASMRDRKAARNQPYKPHIDKKPKQRHHR